jgi:hypothetical protein
MILDYLRILNETEPLSIPLKSIHDKNKFAIRKYGLTEQETKYLRDRYHKNKDGNKTIQ